MGPMLAARDYWRRALDIRRLAVPPHRADLASVLTHLGWALMHLGEPEEAEILAREAQRIWDSHVDPVDWRAANNAQLLSWIVEEKGDLEESLAWTDYSIDLYDRAIDAGKYWSPMIDTLEDAAIAYRSAGRMKESLKILQRELEYRMNLYGPEHRRVIDLLSGISRNLLMTGDFQGTHDYLDRAIKLREADGGSAETYKLLRDRLQMALVLKRLGRHEEARTQYRRSIGLFLDGVLIAAATQPIFVQFPHDLAKLVAETDEHEDALLLFEMASQAAVRYPARHANIHRDWAALLRRTGQGAEALEHELRATELTTVSPAEVGE